MHQTDVAIIGGGIVGLATAYRLTERFPGTKVTILEKEPDVAAHQTGNNSGVLHSGVYYRPGSLRATNCHTGKLAMVEFCEQENIDYELCGKVIVALDESEFPNLERILDRGQQNGVACEMIDRDRLLELEPHVAGIKAIHVPGAGIVDFKQVCKKLAERVIERDGSLLTNARVTGFRQSNGRVTIESTAGEVEARFAVTCAGLQCDRVAKLSGTAPASKVVPFRGEYYELKSDAEYLVNSLIYPVPNPSFPFLGVHFTKMIQGGIECGPNAVLAFAREGYKKTDINLYDLFESLTYPGFLRMAAKNWRIGCGEMWRSFSKKAFVKALQRLLPEIGSDQLESAPAGVRAQAIGRDGKIVDDFVILESELVVNVCNAPSPAATSSLNIGTMIVDKLAKRLES